MLIIPLVPELPSNVLCVCVCVYVHVKLKTGGEQVYRACLPTQSGEQVQ